MAENNEENESEISSEERNDEIEENEVTSQLNDFS